jgi:hypothetical protein
MMAVDGGTTRTESTRWHSSSIVLQIVPDASMDSRCGSGSRRERVGIPREATSMSDVKEGKGKLSM